MDDVEVPAPRVPVETWPTRQAAAYVARVRGIEHDSARKWLTRHVRPTSREPGREGENLWPVREVRVAAITTT